MYLEENGLGVQSMITVLGSPLDSQQNVGGGFVWSFNGQEVVHFDDAWETQMSFENYKHGDFNLD